MHCPDRLHAMEATEAILFTFDLKFHQAMQAVNASFPVVADGLAVTLDMDKCQKTLESLGMTVAHVLRLRSWFVIEPAQFLQAAALLGRKGIRCSGDNRWRGSGHPVRS